MIEHKANGPVDMMTWAFSRIAMWAPAAIVCVIFYEVFMRYLLFKPTLWANELSLWIGGFIYVTSGLYAMQQRSHIRIFILYDLAPLWLRRVFDVLSVMCVCIFVFAVIWGGYGEAAAKYWRWEAFGTAFDPPIPATNKPLVLITLFVLALQAVSNLIRDWPSHPWVRKAFDIAVMVAVLRLAWEAMPALTSAGAEGYRVPDVWRYSLGAMLLASLAMAAWGLVRDFNVTPQPATESSDPADEIELAKQALSGQLEEEDANKKPASGKKK